MVWFQGQEIEPNRNRTRLIAHRYATTFGQVSGLVLKQGENSYCRREVLLVLRVQDCVRLPREGERRGERERETEDERDREMMITDDILYEE